MVVKDLRRTDVKTGSDNDADKTQIKGDTPDTGRDPPCALKETVGLLGRCSSFRSATPSLDPVPR